MPLLRARGPGLRGATAVPAVRVPIGRGPDAAAHVAGRAHVGGRRRPLGRGVIEDRGDDGPGLGYTVTIDEQANAVLPDPADRAGLLVPPKQPGGVKTLVTGHPPSSCWTPARQTANLR